eukprot:352263-Chlamydomonas_euryale.AAC.2
MPGDNTVPSAIPYDSRGQLCRCETQASPIPLVRHADMSRPPSPRGAPATRAPGSLPQLSCLQPDGQIGTRSRRPNRARVANGEVGMRSRRPRRYTQQTAGKAHAIDGRIGTRSRRPSTYARQTAE